jgi:hypothetical protein
MSAPSEVTPAYYPIDSENDGTNGPLAKAIKEYSPKTNDPNELISLWSTLSGPSREDFWNMGLGNGENACFGQTACQEAWLYILDHPDDIIGAKTIASTYCVYHWDECVGDATFDQFVSGAMYDVLMLMGLRAGGGERAACSFDADTPVLMADGTHKPIGDVKVGDEVLAVDSHTGERNPRRVMALIVHQDTVLDLVTEDGSRITTTEDHPFWSTTDGAWERADQLQPGDALLTADGTTVRAVGLDKASAHAATAYNLTVNIDHTYYVGTDPVAVHNTCPMGPRTVRTTFGETIQLPTVSTRLSVQRQGRHLAGDPRYNGGGYVTSLDDARQVLADYHSGRATVLGMTRNGDIVVRTDSVTGYNNNPSAGYLNQSTNVFIIKGTTSPSVVPANPNWRP